MFYKDQYNFLKGSGCPKCSYLSRFITKEEWVKRCNEQHNNKYNYTFSEFKSLEDKVEIECPEHGTFIQQAGYHMRGNRCPECGKIENNRRHLIPTEKLVQLFRKIHGTKFDYSLLDKDSYFKADYVQIICPIHGVYGQQIRTHLRGAQCLKCSEKYHMSNVEFKNEIERIYNGAIDTESINYINNRTRVIIKCSVHGHVHASPIGLIAGTGCPKCRQTKGETRISNFFTKLGVSYIQEYAIKPYRYRYDFFIPSINTLIEYDGAQHYTPVKHWGGEKGFAKQIMRDKIKNRLALIKNIRLIRISYLHDDYIEKYLSRRIDRKYPYFYNKVFYSTLEELYQALGINTSGMTYEDMYRNGEKYRTYKIYQ